MLVSHKSGKGNRNERLHRQFNSVLNSNRYGPEMANALITASFFKHNENILANTEGRPPNSVSAYNGLFTDMGSTECFGLLTPTIDISHPQPLSCKCLLKDLKYNELQLMFGRLLSTIHEDTSSMDSESCLSDDDPVNIFVKVVSCYLISEHLQTQDPIVSGVEAATIFNSFFKTTFFRAQSSR